MKVGQENTFDSDEEFFKHIQENKILAQAALGYQPDEDPDDLYNPHNPKMRTRILKHGIFKREEELELFNGMRKAYDDMMHLFLATPASMHTLRDYLEKIVYRDEGLDGFIDTLNKEWAYIQRAVQKLNGSNHNIAVRIENKKKKISEMEYPGCLRFNVGYFGTNYLKGLEDKLKDDAGLNKFGVNREELGEIMEKFSIHFFMYTMYFCKIVEHNTRMVAKIAHKYKWIMEFDDLFQEGMLGLLRAVEGYDPDRGYRFSTYADWWIEQKIRRYIADKGKMIRIPIYKSGEIAKFKRIIGEINRAGRLVNLKDVAEQMNVSIEHLRGIIDAYKVEKIISLNMSIGDKKDEDEFGDTIADSTVPVQEDIVEETLLKEAIDEALATLTPKEERVLRNRFGIGTHKDSTLEELGFELGLTRERIRQIESKALKRLRHKSISERLMHFLQQAAY